MTQQLKIDGSTDAPAEQTPASTTESVGEESPKSQAQDTEVKDSKDESKTEIIKTSDDAQAKESETNKSKEAYESFKRRKDREVEDLRRQLDVEKKARENAIKSSIGDDKVFDDDLGIAIPKSISIDDYKTLQRANNDIKARQTYISAFNDVLSSALKSNPTVETNLQQAVESGLVAKDLILGAVDPIHNSLEENVENLNFIDGLVKSNPNEISKISSIQNPALRAMKFGELLAKFKNKPDPRISSASPPVKPINEKVSTENPNTLLNAEGDAGYAARKRAHMARQFAKLRN